jgi:hypothetical protein
VASVDQVEAPPLLDAKWTEGEVREARGCVEVAFSAVQDFVHFGEPSRDG